MRPMPDINAEIAPGLCKWYRDANSEDRAAFRAHLGDTINSYVEDWEPRYYQQSITWMVTMLGCMAGNGKIQAGETLQMLRQVWSFAEKQNIDPIPFFRMLADNLEPNQRAGMLVRQMLESR